MVLFFNVVVIGGIVLGMVSLGVGLYYEFFKRSGRKTFAQHWREQEFPQRGD
jgi:hypothetical protein